jgi:periplasmic divalent cation tolerance protein
VSHVQVQFTIDDPATADEIVDSLLTGRLVACGQRMGPMVSRYWWEGTLQRSEEWLVVLKTRAELSAEVVETVCARHPYETPEVVVVAIADGHPGYLAWIDEVTTGGPGPEHRGGRPTTR